MYARTFPRFLVALLALAMLATSCGSGTDAGPDSAAEDANTSTTAVTSSTTTVASSVAEEADDDESMSDDESTGDASVDEDGVVDDDDVDDDDDDGLEDDTDLGLDGDRDISEIELFLGFFGVDEADTASVATCAIAKAESEGMSEDELVDSSALFFVLLDCAPDVAREAMREGFADIDSSSLSANPEQIDCAFDATLDFFADLPLAEVDAVSDADIAPQELVDALVDTCGISQDDADFLLNEA